MATGFAFFALFSILILFGIGFVIFIVANAGRGRDDWFPPQDEAEARRRSSAGTDSSPDSNDEKRADGEDSTTDASDSAIEAGADGGGGD